MPIEGVEVEIAQMSGGVLAPRLTNKFGRYHRLLYYDSFDLKFSNMDIMIHIMIILFQVLRWLVSMMFNWIQNQSLILI